MSGIEFNEPTFISKRRSAIEKISSFEKFLISLGIVKTAKNARIVLAVFVIVTIAFMVFMWSSGDTSGDKYGNYDEFVKNHPELIQ